MVIGQVKFTDTVATLIDPTKDTAAVVRVETASLTNTTVAGGDGWRVDPGAISEVDENVLVSGETDGRIQAEPFG
jgi:archaellum component FlaG (FlaF/FlaG flagellin family)